jgi:hypothetical protein
VSRFLQATGDLLVDAQHVETPKLFKQTTLRVWVIPSARAEDSADHLGPAEGSTRFTPFVSGQGGGRSLAPLATREQVSP